MGIRGHFLLLTLMFIYAGCTPERQPKRNSNNNLAGTNNNQQWQFPTPTPTPTQWVTPTPTATAGPPVVPAFYETVNCHPGGVSRPSVSFPPPENRPIWCRVIHSRGRGSSEAGTLTQFPGEWDTELNYIDSPACAPYSGLASPPLTNACEYAFTTDSEYQVRFRILKEPNGCDTDGNGSADYVQSHMMRYNRLKFDVTFYERNNPFQAVETFTDITNPISIDDFALSGGGGSYAPQYTNIYPVPSSKLNGVSGSLMFKISNVRSDYYCLFNGNTNCTEHDVNWIIGSNNCWAIEVQVSTDQTRAFN